MKNLKRKMLRTLWKASLPIGLGIALLPMAAKADLPAVAVAPRNTLLASMAAVKTNSVTTINTNVPILLTAAYQHSISVFTSITTTNIGVATNSTGSGSCLWTNYFDLGKVTGSSGNLVTNWTTTQPILVTGTVVGLTPLNSATIIAPSSFDGFELLRLSSIGSACTNFYYFTVTVGQTP